MSNLRDEIERHRESDDIDILAGGASLGVAEVREAVASNPACPVPVLNELTEDEDLQVRWAVAENPSASQDCLLSLVVDEDVNVADAAWSSLVQRSLVPHEALQEWVRLVLLMEKTGLEPERAETGPLVTVLLGRSDETRTLALERLELDPSTRLSLAQLDLEW